MSSKITPDDTLIAKTGASLLSSISKAVNNWSMLCTFVALLVISAESNSVLKNALLLFSLLMALLQSYFAIRCSFDAKMFTHLAGDKHQYEELDRLLAQWHLRRAVFVTQSIEQRMQGALKLLRWQICSLSVQLVFMFTAIFSGYY